MKAKIDYHIEIVQKIFQNVYVHKPVQNFVQNICPKHLSKKSV